MRATIHVEQPGLAITSLDRDPDFQALWNFLVNNPFYFDPARFVLLQTTWSKRSDFEKYLSQNYIDKSVRRNRNLYQRLLRALKATHCVGPDEWNLVRGRFAERFVLHKLGYRYDEAQIFDNPEVFRDGYVIRFGNRRSLDAAGWLQNQYVGEFYEAKAGIRYFGEPEVIGYLNELANHLREARADAPVVAITLHNRDVFDPGGELHALSKDNPAIVWLGWEDMLRLDRLRPRAG